MQDKSEKPKTILNVSNLSVSYGLINAVRDVSFHIERNEIVSLIGANGAGKTTIMHTISGLLAQKSGKIEFLSEDISNKKAHKRTHLGLVQVPEGRRVFSQLTVKDNLLLGAWNKKDRTWIDDKLQKVFELFPRLKERASQFAGTLSGGEQQMLAMGRAIMSDPVLLLLDEPSMGLSPLFVNIVFETIIKLRDLGCTIFFVEQNAKKALSIADRGYVLENGRIVLEGVAQTILNDKRVQSAYLGQ